MRLEFLMDFEVRLTHPFPRGQAAPTGQRFLAAVAGGSFEGRLLQGIIAEGGDWGLIEHSGVLRLDARVMFQTHDGAAIYAQYFGVMKSLDGTPPIKSGAGTAFGEQYFMTAPRLETGVTVRSDCSAAGRE